MRGRGDERIRNADWAAAQAGHALRDDELAFAVEWSDRAVTLTRQIVKRRRKKQPVDRRAVDVFAERLWDRSLIHQGLGNIDEAIRDAKEALALIDEIEREHGVEYPLRSPSLRLLLCELSAQAGDAAAARSYGQAIEAFRSQLDQPSHVTADGFARYGWAMHLIGDSAAMPALRQAEQLWRRSEAMPDGRRDAERLVRTMVHIADQAQPATPAGAPEILPMLQYAAACAVRLVPGSYPLHATSANHADARAALETLDRLAVWLRALGAPRLAAHYQRLAEVFPRGQDGPLFWSQLQALVPHREGLVGEAVRRRGDPPEIAGDNG